MRVRVIFAISATVLATSVLAACSPDSANTSDEKPAAVTSTAAATASADSDADPGCGAALRAISKYGPSTVKLLAEGREAVTKAAVQLLVDGLDGAADVADSPRTKQAIRTLADAYDDYFDLTTDAVAIPLSTLLKDTTDLEFVCR